MTNNKTQKGFTLIELLVVISIIGVLSSIVMVSLNDAKSRARDAVRMQDIRQIATALELYNNDHGDYPHIIHGLGYDTGSTSIPGCGHCNRWCTLANALQPYIDPLPREPLGDSPALHYSYSAVPGNNYQSYGLYARMEGTGGQNDKGYYANAFEFGQRVSYCMNKYLGADRDWFITYQTSWSNVCRGGN